ncbi:MATE family efflux transporter [Helicobacter sp. 16-1353]|uniref:MATE family efflux transporter n=1 Tax=Helicobacter sp. 16-1353 TaxID=2004996 RepID=UPI00215D2098|nr:MATE family efflux transporter [Helicobacter sp. 16-1353]
MSKQLSLKALVVPIFLDMFLRFSSLMLNTYMVSQHSAYLVGSMGAGNQILDLFITIFSFLSVGCSVVIAQALGARDFNLAKKAMHQSLFLNALLGFVCGAIILFYGDNLLHFLNVPEGQFSQASIYLKMLGICLFFDAVGIILASIVRVYNMAYFVTLTSLVMNFISVGLNYYTLHYTNWELWGVGLATIIGRVAAIFILLIVLIFRLKIKIYFKELFNLEKEVLKKVLKIGSFSAGENLIWIIQYTIALSFVYSLGAEYASVQTIYFQISMFIMLTGAAFSIANEIIIGKLVGARATNVAYKHTWRVLYLSLFVTLIVVLINFFGKDFIMDKLGLESIFREIMLPLFGLSIVLELGRTFNIVMVNSLRASGDAKFPFIMGLIFMLGVSLPVGYTLCFHFGFGIVGVWIGFCFDEWLRGLCNAYRWKSRKWQDKAVV